MPPAMEPQKWTVAATAITNTVAQPKRNAVGNRSVCMAVHNVAQKIYLATDNSYGTQACRLPSFEAERMKFGPWTFHCALAVLECGGKSARHRFRTALDFQVAIDALKWSDWKVLFRLDSYALGTMIPLVAPLPAALHGAARRVLPTVKTQISRCPIAVRFLPKSVFRPQGPWPQTSR